MEETKGAVQSKVIWINGIVLLIGILGLVAGSDLLADYPQAVTIIGMAIAALNVVLRFFSNTPVSIVRVSRIKNSMQQF